MKKSLMLATLVMLGACKQVEVDKIVIKRSAEFSGDLSAKVEIGEETHTINLTDEVSEFGFPTQKVSSVDFKLKFRNSVEVNKERISSKADIELTGKIGKDGVKIKDGDVELNGKHLSNINCKNIVKVENKERTLIVDLSSFKSLASCQGSDIELYRSADIGKRNLNPNEDSFLRGNYFSMEDDKKFGKEFTDDFLAKNKESVLPTDHPTSVYIQDLLTKVAEVSDMPDLEPKTYVINADIMNAFALPGGYVFVFRGLIDKVHDESELVGVLGHEWAHVTARHGTENMSRSIRAIGSALLLAAAAQGVAAVKKEEKYKIIADLVSGAAIGGAYLSILNKGRKAELEADRLGSQYSLRLDFEPFGIAKMFQTFKEVSGNRSVTTLEKLTSSHPQHDERIEQVSTLSSMFYQDEKTNYVVNTSDFDYAKEEMLKVAVSDSYGSEITGKAFVEALDSKMKNEIEKAVQELQKED
jgi:Zn-dependent protease with chaperone function